MTEKEFLEVVKSINLQSFKRMVDNPAVDAFIAKGYQKDFENEEISNYLKTTPPVKLEKDRDALWEGLIDDTISLVPSAA